MTPPRTNQLTPAMTYVLQTAQNHAGVLVRHPGGFWSWPGCPGRIPHLQWTCGTPTVEALVRRGRMFYTKWQDGRKGPFPVQVEVFSAGVFQPFETSPRMTEANA